jgi:hypothetical protein
MTTVAELIPGDIVDVLPLSSGTFIARTQHPIWPHLQLVVWRLADSSWSLDALDARQDVGEARAATHLGRDLALRDALLGDQR